MTEMLTRRSLAPSTGAAAPALTLPDRIARPTQDTHVLSPLVVDTISAELWMRGIKHGDLVEGEPCLNHNLSDGTRVFCKVSRVGDISPRPGWEVTGARMAAAAGIPGTTALIDAPFEVVDDSGHARQVTVWRFEQSCSAPSLVDQARLVADAAARIPLAAVDTSQAPVFDLMFFADRIERRLGPMAALGERDSLAILARARDYFAAALDLIDSSRFAWMHGDAHLKNVLWRVDGAPMFVDWESHCVGPVEWDLAAIVRACFQSFPSHDRDTQFRAARAAIKAFGKRVDFDRDLALLFISARGTSYQSHLHTVGHDPATLALTYEVDDLVRRGHIARLFG